MIFNFRSSFLDDLFNLKALRPVIPYASYSIPTFLFFKFNSSKISLRSSEGFDPSLSTQILISSILDVFCSLS